MEAWVPLFDIFLNSPTPETEASLWLQQSSSFVNASSSVPITTASFLSLLTKPILNNSSTNRRIMFLQTLPFLVQSRILSFLGFEHQRFCKRELSMLARTLLTENNDIDFWVNRAARILLDKVSDSSYQWISCLSLDSGEERVVEEFGSIPDWLKDAASSANELFLPWLPLSHDILNSRELFAGYESEEDFLSQVGEVGGDNSKDFVEEKEIDRVIIAPLDDEIQNMAESLKERIMSFESSSKTVELANEIRRLSLESKADSYMILSLLEPWKADDENASILIFHLSNGSEEEELAWPTQVLCSIMLPKMLVLEEPASRVLVTAMVEYCKLNQRAAECALLFPLIMKRNGINNYHCDVITRIVKECLHPAHVSAFCQKLLCGQEVEKRSIVLPCHQCLISSELVWTESLFNLFQNILNHNVQLTQDSVDQLVLVIRELAPSFSKSLKVGNFLLCFITRCSSLSKSHIPLLVETVVKTNTLVTKSILSKLASL
ncbi:unnamed protein product [Dovyalis caffra]|uniref:Fanconi Anaemia group E protein C-terminal domain-containing protein n=1 Tax=Dovyalis caffra TaxID=77055 RepID=A0AAV1SKJ2_9ROSI|nr:unnamed protein product [Dovyalis caffra]